MAALRDDRRTAVASRSSPAGTRSSTSRAGVEEFRQIAAVAAAQGIGVVNGGYPYDSALVEQLPGARRVRWSPSWTPTPSPPTSTRVDPAEELALAPFLATARAPAGPPRLRRGAARLPPGRPCRRCTWTTVSPGTGGPARPSRSQADELWAGILGALRGSEPRARLVLNHLNPLVRRIGDARDPDLAGTALEALYGQALLMAQRPLRPADSALLNRTFLGLLERAAHAPRRATTVRPDRSETTARTTPRRAERRPPSSSRSDPENDQGPGHRAARPNSSPGRAAGGARSRHRGALSLVCAYDCGSELEKMFLPFVRLLRMWDEQPEDFDAEAKHRLHWSFKWVVSGMLGRPHVPLASVGSG